MGAADTLGAGFTNNGAPVLDRATHIGNLPPEFRDSGTRLAGRIAAAGRGGRGPVGDHDPDRVGGSRHGRRAVHDGHELGAAGRARPAPRAG